MQFALHYRGKLKANGKPPHKHELRKHFHKQLLTLWNQPPLSEYFELRTRADYNGDLPDLIRPKGDFQFVPLIAADISVVAELKIELLRPEPPGNLITQGGDMDNRLKTLFDALTIPVHAEQIPLGTTPEEDETPFFCLLEDDNLITSISVANEQLLEPTEENIVDARIFVHTRALKCDWGNNPWW